MAYSLTQAAAAAGRTRSTILRAIQTGRISATRDATTAAWVIEPAELHRVYPIADRQVLDAVDQPADGGGDATALIAAKDALIAGHEATIADLRHRLDMADEERRRLTLLLADQRTAPPAPAWRAWWPWRHQ